MADLGVDSAAVRSSVSRLKKRDVLDLERRDGQAGYALSPTTLEMLREGDSRIWSRPRATAADGWVVLVFSVPEAERVKRHALRSLLTGLGFGSVAPGVWVAPGTSYDETVRALDRQGLTAYTEFFRGDYLGSGDVSTRMAEWWDLDELDRPVRRVLRHLPAPCSTYPCLIRRGRSRSTCRCSRPGADCPTSIPACRSSICPPTGPGSRPVHCSPNWTGGCVTSAHEHAAAIVHA